MNIYRGQRRRQVGGSIWSTIVKGLSPLLKRLLSTMKPHAIEAGKHAAKSALTVGSRLAMDAVSGDFNKARAKTLLKNEAKQLKADAIRGLKRKILEPQEGQGYKRRRIQQQKPQSRQMARKTKQQPKKGKAAARKSTKKSMPRKQYKRRKVVKQRRHCTKKSSIKDIFS